MICKSLFEFYPSYSFSSTYLWPRISPNVTIFSTDNLTADIHDLHPSYKYHVRALAVNAIGIGLPSNEITIFTDEEAPSGPPTDVKVQASGSTSLKLTWRPPLYENQNGKIIGYHVGFKRHNSSEAYEYTQILTENNSDLELQVKNLLKFTRYDLHVRAYNGKGMGPISADVTAFTLEDVPSLPPQNVKARAFSSTSIEISWAESPYYTMQGVLQGYKVLYKEVRTDEDETEASQVRTSQFRVTIYNLKKYTNYSIEVLAFTRMGEGARSEPIYVRTHEDVPSRPSAIKAIVKNRNSVQLIWEPPQQHNGILLKYIIRYSNGSDGPPNKESRTIELKVIRTSHVISRLQEDNEYIFTVNAMTSAGESEPTVPVRATPSSKGKPFLHKESSLDLSKDIK
ncbi:DSCAML1 [Acanthosepion pharaonis]|uniref:DSCAML1 n=1 Tax=Acanthosepion pharaonis TaxID=158019 RepID=A0A812AS24_ACAPH|nr:DSCAML1 [Sepia pharaonis]